MIGLSLAIQIVILLGMFGAQYVARVVREEGKFEIDGFLKMGVYIK